MRLRSNPGSVSEAENISGYTLTSTIATSNFSSIQLAARANDDGVADQVLIRRLITSGSSGPENRLLLLGAANVASLLDSPFFPRVLDTGDVPRAFVVHEYIRGATLESQLQISAPQGSLRFMLPVLVDVLTGLHALHTLETALGKRYVHGAPVARHILVGSNGRARILDLTHAVGPGMPWFAAREDRLNPSEMAPEQALAPAHVDQRCDIFIVGAVLWRALTGAALFSGSSREEQMRNLLSDRRPAIGSSGRRSLHEIEAVCLRAISRSRSERYESAADMAHNLRAASTEAGVFASPDEISAWLQTPTNRVVSARPIARGTLIGLGPSATSNWSKKAIDLTAERSPLSGNLPTTRQSPATRARVAGFLALAAASVAGIAWLGVRADRVASEETARGRSLGLAEPMQLDGPRSPAPSTRSTLLQQRQSAGSASNKTPATVSRVTSSPATPKPQSPIRETDGPKSPATTTSNDRANRSSSTAPEHQSLPAARQRQASMPIRPGTPVAAPIGTDKPSRIAAESEIPENPY